MTIWTTMPIVTGLAALVAVGCGNEETPVVPAPPRDFARELANAAGHADSLCSLARQATPVSAQAQAGVVALRAAAAATFAREAAARGTEPRLRSAVEAMLAGDPCAYRIWVNTELAPLTPGPEWAEYVGGNRDTWGQIVRLPGRFALVHDAAVEIARQLGAMLEPWASVRATDTAVLDRPVTPGAELAIAIVIELHSAPRISAVLSRPDMPSVAPTQLDIPDVFVTTRVELRSAGRTEILATQEMRRAGPLQVSDLADPRIQGMDGDAIADVELGGLVPRIVATAIDTLKVGAAPPAPAQ